MKDQIAKLKAHNKTLVQKHKETKSYYMEVRSYHIAYCLLRGRTIEQIESKLRDPNSWIHRSVRMTANKIVEEIRNPKPSIPPEVKPVEVKKESLWNKVLNSLY